MNRDEGPQPHSELCKKCRKSVWIAAGEHGGAVKVDKADRSWGTPDGRLTLSMDMRGALLAKRWKRATDIPVELNRYREHRCDTRQS